MNEIDLPEDENKSSHHSLIIRCWRDSLGGLRGQIINPVTDRSLNFTSVDGMHQALDFVIEETPMEES